MKYSLRLSAASALLAAVLVSGCVHLPRFTPADCPADKRDVDLEYGVINPNAPNAQSILRVKEKQEVKQDGAVVFRLKPRSPAFEASIVTIVGKGGPGSKNSWIYASDPYSTRKELVVCVPANQKTGEYEYDIIVNDFGKLDPRLDVIP